MKKTLKKKRNVNVQPALFAAGTVFLLLAFITAGLFLPVSAQNYGVSAEWSGNSRQYDFGEEITVEFSLTGLEPGRACSGTITAEITGLDFLLFEKDPGFDISPGIRPGADGAPNLLTVAFSTEGNFSITTAGKTAVCMAKCAIGRSSPETVIKIRAEIISGDSKTDTPVSIFTINRKAVPTEAPTKAPTQGPGETPEQGGATEIPTMVPTQGPTPTPTPTVPLINTPSPEATTESPTPTAAAAPEESDGPGQQGGDPGENDNNGNKNGDDAVKIGAVIFWAAVALVAGVWIGIATGASIRKKKPFFVTEEEKKIIGKK